MPQIYVSNRHPQSTPGPPVHQFVHKFSGHVDYVRNLVYDPRNLNRHAPQILDRLHHIQSFQFEGNILGSWSDLDPRLRESFSRIIHSVTQLDISFVQDFPINIFIPCINLIELTLDLSDRMVDNTHPRT